MAKMEHGAHIRLSDGAAYELDYNLVGDIIKLIPVPIPIDSSFQPTFTPYIKICGTVDTTNDIAHTFHINTHQYVAFLKTSDQNQSQKFQSLMPVECVIPDTHDREISSGSKQHYIPRLSYSGLQLYFPCVTPTPTQSKLKFNFFQTNKATQHTFSEEEIHDDETPSKHPRMC
ncbi:hypothetical protein P692DRAFT_201862768 [Suillus brevipes Sb2]|nr:hypothetical protein P692DRAFT_201862768 [Suillus brevipes Sb2]